MALRGYTSQRHGFNGALPGRDCRRRLRLPALLGCLAICWFLQQAFVQPGSSTVARSRRRQALHGASSLRPRCRLLAGSEASAPAPPPGWVQLVAVAPSEEAATSVAEIAGAVAGGVPVETTKVSSFRKGEDGGSVASESQWMLSLWMAPMALAQVSNVMQNVPEPLTTVLAELGGDSAASVVQRGVFQGPAAEELQDVAESAVSEGLCAFAFVRDAADGSGDSQLWLATTAGGREALDAWFAEQGLAFTRADWAAISGHPEHLEKVLSGVREGMTVEAKIQWRRSSRRSQTAGSSSWAAWVADFKRKWDIDAAMQPKALDAVRSAIAGGNPTSWKDLDVAQLLPADQPKENRPGLLISSSPLVTAIPNFASPAECAALINLGFQKCEVHATQELKQTTPGAASGASMRGVATCTLDYADLGTDEQGLLERIEERIAQLTGVPRHTEECRPFLKFDRPGGDSDGTSTSKDDLNVGLHVDPNGGFSHRVCTVILYLNDCESGRTVFPCVGDQASHSSSRQLVSGGQTHTSSQGLESGGLAQEGKSLLERAETADDALRVAPTAGTALLFFSLLDKVEKDTEGKEFVAVDPLTWHGGASVRNDAGKWTVQFFKEVPFDKRRDAVSEASYVGGLRERVLQAAST
eukprot:TRINITY_DN58147_c0_g1_i1.p1 TRINITY_DN58147_c0_g1~~TRINITY_DN58147_c0_g1_i1.p1  ORF type:complete len:641 (+),score=138.37 TRINITY_DN58147_c0_g1_i1:56-1978(+)